jgi:hypothetical protein
MAALLLCIRGPVRMSMRGFMRVRPDLRLEGCLFYLHPQAQAANHVVKDVIVVIAQPSTADLQCNVAITQVIGGAEQLRGFAPMHSRYELRRGAHFDDAAIIGKQEISAAQYLSASDDNGSSLAGGERRPQATATARFIGQFQACVRRTTFLQAP